MAVESIWVIRLYWDRESRVIVQTGVLAVHVASKRHPLDGEVSQPRPAEV